MTTLDPTTARPPLPDTGQLALPLTVPEVDAHLAARAVTSADMLTGLIAAHMLDVAGNVDKLPRLLFPHLTPGDVDEVWQTALAVGYRAGKMAGAPRWRPEDLDRLRGALLDAGYTVMGAQVEVTTSHGRRPTPDPADADADTGDHPADADLPPGDRPTARGDHPAPR